MTLKKYGDKIPGRNDYRILRLPFRVVDIYNVYIGKQGCACGCGGNYYFGAKGLNNPSSSDKDEVEKMSVSEKKKHLRMSKFAYNKIRKLAKTNKDPIEVIDNNIYSWEGETRAIRVYLNY